MVSNSRGKRFMRVQSNSRAGVMSQPLYAQVRERLLERIVSKEWHQGQVLPNEFHLAREFGVSIGTIRKAVEGLEAAKIVVRKQGRGTFVSRASVAPPTEPVSVFGTMIDGGDTANIATLSVELRTASIEEKMALELAADLGVIEILRCRTFRGGARVLDRICLPRHLSSISSRKTRCLEICMNSTVIFLASAWSRIRSRLRWP